MNLEQLQYIIEIERAKQISKAAENVHITQSALSQSVKNLENELGLKIFTRSKKGSEPTPNGEKIIEHAKKIMHEIERIKQIGVSNEKVGYGNLNIEAAPGFFVSILPKTLTKFKLDYPEVEISFHEQDSFQIFNHVKENRIDLGIVILDVIPDDKQIVGNVLYEGTMCLLVNKHSSFAKQKHVDPEEILHEKFVLYKGRNTETLLQQILGGEKLKNVLFTTNNTETIKNSVASGLGNSFGIDFFLKNDPLVQSGDLIVIPIKHKSAKRKFGFIYSIHTEMDATMREFITYLKKEIK